MRMPLLAMLLTSLFALGACTAPGGSAGDGSEPARDTARAPAAPAPSAAPPATDRPATDVPSGVKPGAAAARPVDVAAPPMSEPLPPVRSAGAVDRSCRTDADCAVKNVGSCCGAMPACVNTAARPDPAAVQAQCQREGMSSTCGFKEIQGCACVAGTCQDAAGGVVDR